MICDSGLHRRSHAQRLVNLANVIVHVVQGNRMAVIITGASVVGCFEMRVTRPGLTPHRIAPFCA
jgi:hypothetical protein